MVNTKKTKVMICSQGNHTKDEKNWLYKGEKLETVKEFKYLGYWFSRSGNYKKHTKWTSGKAHQALNSTWGVIKRSGKLRSIVWSLSSEPYWRDQGIKPWMNEIWTKLRCGNISKHLKKGFSKDWSCRLCKGEAETSPHLFICREVMNACDSKVAQHVRQLVDGKFEVYLEFAIKDILRGPPIKEVCMYFEKVLDRMKFGTSEAEPMNGEEESSRGWDSIK
ncbi:Protein of unknown function, partial [Cotesia congregata]